MSDQRVCEKAVFNVACGIQSEELRREYLRQVCGDLPEVLTRIEGLLRAHDCDPGFLEPPPRNVAVTIDLPPVSERPGSQIGPYKLVEEIGEGGMGIVYMAVQKEPVRRKVALKIVKPGMDTREVIARFGAEQQTLALMDHPHIAKVHDAGTTESGRPYFVMELVNGVPLTQYCDDNHLATRERLDLFVQVCHAVQHAHQKGIIHRDIKPSNILVTLHDGVPVPKIIDFGIAKAMGGGLISDTLATGFGQMLGTPLYMSPEQAERSGLDIDTRSDVYSLGVLLYELLTGSTPFDREQLKQAGLDEVRRIIREEEPPRPSTRISTMGMAATTVSEHRRTSPVELSNSLRHELDWIVMKALEKDRTRRYESANDFARDIQRYLQNEAVEACPPSTIYRLRKFTRRHQAAVIATAAVSLALILGAGVAAGQAYRATKAEKYAEEQLQIAQDQERLAKQQTQLAKKQKKLAEESAQRERDLRTEAEAARKQSEAVTSFLVDIFRSPDPERDGRTITVAEMLDQAKTRVETEFKEDKLLQAKLLGAIGETYFALGLIPDATQLSKRSYDILLEALGPQNVDTLAALQHLADAHHAAGRWDESLPLMEETSRLRNEVLGPEHPDTLQSMSKLAMVYLDAGQAEQVQSLAEKTLRLQKEKLGPEHPDTLTSMNCLAIVHARAGRWQDAVPLHAETLRLRKEKLGPDHPDTLIAMNNLAVAYGLAGQYDKSLPLYEQVLERIRNTLGPEHPTTITSMNNLAAAYGHAGQYDKSLPLFEQTLALRRKIQGPEHPQTLHTMGNLAATYWSMRRLDQALPLFEDTLSLSKEVLGENHPETLNIMVNLGCNYLNTGQLDKALGLLEESLVKCKKQLAPDHPTMLLCMWNLGGAYVGQRRFDEALPLLNEAIRLSKESLGAEHPETLGRMNSLASIYWQLQQLDQAIPLFEETLKLSKKVRGEDHPETLMVMANLGQNYTDDGRLNEAIALLDETCKKCQQKLGPEHETTLLSMNNLAIAYSKADRLADAVQLMGQAVELWKKTLGPEHPETLDGTMSLVGFLVQQADYAAAEPLLIGVHEAIAKRQATTPSPSNAQSLQAVTALLVQHYTKTDQPDKAKEWQEKLDALQSGASKPESKEN